MESFSYAYGVTGNGARPTSKGVVMRTILEYPRPADADVMLDAEEVAALCKCSPATISRAARMGQFAPPVRIGGLRRWRLGAIRVWMALAVEKRGNGHA